MRLRGLWRNFNRHSPSKSSAPFGGALFAVSAGLPAVSVFGQTKRNRNHAIGAAAPTGDRSVNHRVGELKRVVMGSIPMPMLFAIAILVFVISGHLVLDRMDHARHGDGPQRPWPGVQ